MSKPQGISMSSAAQSDCWNLCRTHPEWTAPARARIQGVSANAGLGYLRGHGSEMDATNQTSWPIRNIELIFSVGTGCRRTLFPGLDGLEEMLALSQRVSGALGYDTCHSFPRY
jgi:hypothetical protein